MAVAAVVEIARTQFNRSQNRKTSLSCVTIDRFRAKAFSEFVLATIRENPKFNRTLSRLDCNR